MSEQTLFRLRVAYVKRGRLRYLGHLEVLHTIERSVRRAGLPFAVTQGFSPHMRAAFSSALPVGASSRLEYYDLYLTEYVSAPRALEALRAATPAGLDPIDASYIDVRSSAPTAWLTRATWTVGLAWRDGAAIAEERVVAAIGEVVADGAVTYLRNGKPKRLDLARTLESVEVASCDDRSVVLELRSRMDNEGSLRPDILVAALDRRLAQHPGGEAEEPIELGGRLALFSSCVVERTWQGPDDEGDA